VFSKLIDSSRHRAYELIEKEHARRKRRKAYFIKRIKSDYDLIDGRYKEFKELLKNYLRSRSDDSWFKLDQYSEKMFVPYIKNFTADGANQDITPILDILDSPRLADKFGPMLSFLGTSIKTVLEDRKNWMYARNEDILNSICELDNIALSIRNLMNDLDLELADN